MTLVRFLHLIALAFFVGGQLLFVVAVVPALRGQGDRTAIRAVARRFGIGSLVALAVLFATGAAMADRYGRWSDGVLQVKLTVVVLIAVLIGFHLARPQNRLLMAAVFVASLAVVWLGVELAH